MKKQAKLEHEFWEKWESNGLTAVTVPGDLYIRPAKGRDRYAKRWGSFVTNDPRFGPGSLVYYRYESDFDIYVKDVILEPPEEFLAALLDNDGVEFSAQRSGEEHGVGGQQDSGLDENGDYHCGALDKIAFENWYRGKDDPYSILFEDEETEEDADTIDEEKLIGELSDNPIIRNKQVRYMCGIINRAVEFLPEKNREVYYELFGQCMKAVDIAAEMNVGDSAISNHRSRIISKMGQVFTELGYSVPTKKELKAEKKAAQKREEEILRIEMEERAEQKEILLLRAMTVLFYEEGMLNIEEKEQLERELDEAA